MNGKRKIKIKRPRDQRVVKIEKLGGERDREATHTHADT